MGDCHVSCGLVDSCRLAETSGILLANGLGEALGDLLGLAVELISAEKLLDLLAGVLPESDILSSASGPEKQIKAWPGDAVGATKFGGDELPLADVPVDGLPVNLEIVG